MKCRVYARRTTCPYLCLHQKLVGFFFQWGTKCYETYIVIEKKGGPDKMTDLSGLNSISIGLLGKHFQLIGSVFSKEIWEM